MAKQTPAIVHIPALAARVKQVASAYGAITKAQSKLGDVVLKVAPTLAESEIKPFCSMLTQTLTDAGHPAGSVKTTVSYIRRVVTAIVVDGLEIEPGDTLRGMYESLKKEKTGAAAHAGRVSASDEDKVTVSVTPEKRAEAIKAAATVLFGYSEPDLLAALAYAKKFTDRFIKWAQASEQAELASELESTAPVATKRTKRKVESATV